MKKLILAASMIVASFAFSTGSASALFNCRDEVDATTTHIRYVTRCDSGRGLQRSLVWYRDKSNVLHLRFGPKVGRGVVSPTPWSTGPIIDEAGIEHWTRDGEFVVYVCKIGCS